ncbi:MAG: DUF2309 domain-containing protein [Nitrospiria bacterium]
MMDLMQKKQFSDASRMSMLARVKLVSERAATSWPMHTFISRNSLHDFEYLEFKEALLQGKRHLGGEGYLKNQLYRQYYQRGRILEKHLDAALKPIVSESEIVLNGRKITHREVLRAHFIHGISSPAPEILEAAVQNNPAKTHIETLAKKLSTAAPSEAENPIDHFVSDTHSALAQRFTLSGWLDSLFETGLTGQINQEMIKWCLPFLDEGQSPWPLPFREEGLVQSWKKLAARESAFSGIAGIKEKLEKIPEHPTDLLIESLEALGIPEPLWEDYLGLHLSALTGWTALMKWRSEHHDYRWQEACPVTLIQYLGIRLWYEREWVSKIAREQMGISGTLDAFLSAVSASPSIFFLRRERAANRLPASRAETFDRLCHRSLEPKDPAWERLANQYAKDAGVKQRRLQALSSAWRIVSLSKTLDIAPEHLLQSPLENLKSLTIWLDETPETRHGPVWLEALEAGFQERLLKKLKPGINVTETSKNDVSKNERPEAQAVFCIDVRSESFRRHLEKTGHYETFGFAGFFAALIRYKAFGSHHETDLYPAVAKAKNVVKEIPRPFQEKQVPRFHAGADFIHAAHALFHDLKENVITPYVMVESIGWFFGIPLIGKTLFPAAYLKWARWLKNRLAPPVATTLTIDKLTRETVMNMIASEQRAIITEALRARTDVPKKGISTEAVELLRKFALHGGTAREAPGEAGKKKLDLLFSTPEKRDAFIHALREVHSITEAWASARMERITRTGFSESEQVITVKTALSVMGLTRNFAKLVLFCGHGSTSENNPYEAALDCGACGGNPGNPNARVLAALANKAHVREHLKKENIIIPDDTHFIAGQHDTTTDEVVIYDREDLPSTHKNALDQLILDLKQAGADNSRERSQRFPDAAHSSKTDAGHEGLGRSATWSQTRPEWGLSGNAAMIISSGSLIKDVDLDGRVFLHSYRQEDDPTGQLLEIIMTGPQVVAQWINMEYYFSTTDNEVYGSGSKIYHNVAGRIGVMYGATSDLRMGLPAQSLFTGETPYHEPMRLFTLIQAPRDRIQNIISRHRVLQEHFNHQWVHLAALEKGRIYRYIPGGTWREENE